MRTDTYRSCFFLFCSSHLLFPSASCHFCGLLLLGGFLCVCSFWLERFRRNRAPERRRLDRCREPWTSNITTPLPRPKKSMDRLLITLRASAHRTAYRGGRMFCFFDKRKLASSATSQRRRLECAETKQLGQGVILIWGLPLFVRWFVESLPSVHGEALFCIYIKGLEDQFLVRVQESKDTEITSLTHGGGICN